jgi:ubiquitin-protein ligase
MNFKVAYSPDEGYWKTGKFFFDFKFGQGYPHKPPSVKVRT